ncbi:MAG: outer membrane protein assembly factor BamB [Planctomycetota bacterium]
MSHDTQPDPEHTLMLRTLILTAVLAPSAFSGQDWPQWRGPDRNGISSETDWSSEGQAEALWTKAVGLGYSAVSISAGKLYTAGWDKEQEKDVIYCLDAVSGEELWSYSYPAKKWAQYHGGGTNCTPSVDGDDVYVLNREGMYTLLDAKTGKLRWTIDLHKEHNLELPTWGFAASPLVLDDMIVLHVGKVLAFQKGKKKLLWESKEYGHAYSTPAASEMGGKDVLAVMGGKSFVVLDQSNGKELAQSKWETQYDVNAATPIVVDDERIWISSGYGHGGAMLAFTGDEILELWGTKSMKNKMATSLLIDDHIYGIDEAVLKCFNLDGEELWAERGIGQGALSAAGERLLVHTSKGDLAVVSANPESYEELSRAKVTSGGVCWTMPVLVNGRIYVRSSKGELVVRDHRMKD